VRYWPDRFSDPIVEQVTDENRQTELLRHLLIDRGLAAEPVTLIAQPDAPALARARRGIAEDIVAQYATDEMSGDVAWEILARLTPALRWRTDTSGVSGALHAAV